MRIHEIFESIQGEGIWLGMPSHFIRVAGCNLRCRWCDTVRARSMRDSVEWSVDELVQRALVASMQHVVITGGEPTQYAEELKDLCKELRRAGKTVTVESNATRFVHCAAHLMSLSPKAHAWREDVLKEYVRRSERVQVKLVAGSVQEAKRLYERVTGLGIPNEQIFVMPRARTRGEHLLLANELIPWCMARGVRVGVRAQTLLWNNAAGR